jgi:hypothetical protein
MEFRPPAPESNFENTGNKFEKGQTVRLKKYGIYSGKESAVQAGEVLGGDLKKSLQEGRPVRLDNGANTSVVSRIINKTDRTFIKTQTSTYEISLFEEDFPGLNIENKWGKVQLSETAHVADDEVGCSNHPRRTF